MQEAEDMGRLQLMASVWAGSESGSVGAGRRPGTQCPWARQMAGYTSVQVDLVEIHWPASGQYAKDVVAWSGQETCSGVCLAVLRKWSEQGFLDASIRENTTRCPHTLSADWLPAGAAVGAL